MSLYQIASNTANRISTGLSQALTTGSQFMSRTWTWGTTHVSAGVNTVRTVAANIWNNAPQAPANLKNWVVNHWVGVSIGVGVVATVALAYHALKNASAAPQSPKGPQPDQPPAIPPSDETQV